EFLCAAPIAGPEEMFRKEVYAAASMVFELYRENAAVEFGEFARLYADTALDVPSDRLPLSKDDRVRLRGLYLQYLERREESSPLWGQPPKSLQSAFASVGYTPARPVKDVDPAHALASLTRIQQRLRYLVYKHCALRRVRELCRIHQRKWSLAGPLAPLDATALREVLDALVERHLVLREADGSFSVHPAVRDHFARLGSTADQGDWHDIIREQLISLVQRPGRHLPEDPVTL